MASGDPLLSIWALIILTTSISSTSALNVFPKPKTFLWPSPQANPLSKDFTIEFEMHPYLSRIVSRYSALIKTKNLSLLVPPSVNYSSSHTPLQALRIVVCDPDATLQHGVNETYALNIPPSGATASLMAQTVWGASRGLESFYQLVWGSPLRVATGVCLEDAPLFPHRGLMLNTLRNYFAVDGLKRVIKGMDAIKLNVLHWRLPSVIPYGPELSAKSDMVYTSDDVKEILEFGLSHGVRVLPEINILGSSWSDRLAAELGTDHQNPLHSNIYRVLENVIADGVKLFPEPFYHGGASEIFSSCRNGDPTTVQSFLSKGGKPSQGLKKFINSTLHFILSHNRTAVFRENGFLDALIKEDPSHLPSKHTILQTWKNGPKNTKKLVDAGYRVIDLYDLGCGHGDFVGNDTQNDPPPGNDQGNGISWCASFKTWQMIYNHDITYGLSKEEAKLVLGGEVALCSQQSGPRMLDARLWQRFSAMAETFWSGNKDEKGMNRSAEATPRLKEWQYRMVERGIVAEPV